MRIRLTGTLLLIALVLSACGHSARTKSLSTSLLAVDVAADTVAELSDKRQEQIVHDAATLDEGVAQLAAFRAKRAPVVDVIARAYKAIAAAALGETELTEVAKTVRDAVTAAKEFAHE